MSSKKLHKQTGTILILVGLTLIILLGMAGLVIDLGRLYVNKTELQSATDSCSLAAAQELDGASDALARATNAGLVAGNANKVNYQAGSASIIAGDITFSDALNGSYRSNFTPVSNASYAKCTHTTSGILAYLIQQVGGASRNSVAAVSVATKSHGQTTCAIPIGAMPNAGGTKSNNYGYTVGQWIPVYFGGAIPGPGAFGVANLNGSNSGSETRNEMKDPGYCTAKAGDSVGTPGAKTGPIDDLWNRRFGIYGQGKFDPTMPPDLTGYAYTTKNWLPGNSAFSDFKTKRVGYYSYANVGGNNPSESNNTVQAGDSITGLNIKPGGYNKLATGGIPPSNATDPTQWQHYHYGNKNERIVVVPILDSSNKILDFLCVLMLQPIAANQQSSATPMPSYFEFVGLAGNSGSPCITYGLPGSSSGPLVATLVQ